MKSFMLTLVSFLIVSSSSIAAPSEKIVTLKTETRTLEGTLLTPETKDKIPVALIIAGSGPTDRDGNNPLMQNNSLKMLASELFKNGIATLRYDKRGIGQSKMTNLNESELRFDNYIQDAKEWLDFLKRNQKFNQIIVIGHSEGSLIGMIASHQKDVDKFISIAGSGQPADQIIREQLKAQPTIISEQSTPILDKLSHGETVKDVPPLLQSLFRPSVQPYLISWFQYDPQEELAKFKKPILILQGTTDIQVSVKDAEILAKANQRAQKIIINDMNHIMKKSELDRQKNLLTYSQPDLPIKTELIKATVDFIKQK
ncbi:MAG: lysophospholipase [Planctomycetes bacterium]|nr:lysophospholipase [Planctomycetota bacterium]MCH9726665.1 lysophospholipase [Planctomycetota bacterium]MCH9779573.1 lysophospholipase [Planctomycetota bacterium]